MRSALDVLRLVHLRELRRHPVRTAIAVVAVAAGVAMLLAIVVVVRSTTVSFEDQARATAGPAPLRVVGPTAAAGVLPADVEAIRAVDGVAAAVPLVRGLASIERYAGGDVEHGHEVLVLGVDCGIAGSFGVSCETLGDGLVVTPALGEGSLADAALRTDDGAIAFAEMDLTVDERLTELGPRVAVTSLPTAQRFFGRGDAVDLVYVLPDDGVPVDVAADRINATTAEGLEVLRVTDLPPELNAVVGTIIPLFSLIGLFALAIGVVLVANTVALSLEERRVQLAVVTSLGGTSREVLVGSLVQAGVIGAAGGLLGAGMAALAAYPLTSAVNQFTLGISGIRVEAMPSQTPVVAAVIMGVVVASAAAWRPARRATRSDVAAELSLRERRAESGMQGLARKAAIAVVAGAIATVAAVAGGADGSLKSWQPLAAWIGLFASIVAVAFAMGRVGSLVAAVVLRRVRVTLPPVRLALANLVREPSRTGVMILAAGAAVSIGYVTDSYTEQAEAGIRQSTDADFGGGLLVSIGPADGGDQFARIPTSVADAVRDHPQVDHVDSAVFLFTNADGEAIGITGAEGGLADRQVYAGSADPDRFAAGEIMVGAGLARRQGIEPGGVAVLPTHDGPVNLPVQGIWADGNGVGMNVTVPLTLAQEHWGPIPTGSVVAYPVDGVTSEQLAASMHRDIADPALRVETPEQVTGRWVSNIDSQIAPFKALQVGLTALAFVAVLSTLLLVGIQRHRELGLLSAAGMTPRSIFAMVLTEAGLVGVIAAAVALPLATLQGFAFQAVVPMILGWENPTRFDLSAWFSSGVLTTVVVVASAAFPAWRAARVDVVEALAYE